MMATDAATRARRLLALLHLLEKDTRHSLETMAEMLGTTVAELAEDLDTLSCCGVAPYDPYALTPVFVDDGVVEVFGEVPALAHPVRLSATEAHALAAALQAAGMGADDSLTSRLMAAAASPEVSAQEMERVVRAVVAPGSGDVLKTVTAALDERLVLDIDYQSSGENAATMRSIEPLALVTERGAWYVEAYCRRAAALRTFRVDRIRAARATTETFQERDLEAAGVAFAADHLPTARVLFANNAGFTLRDWPGSRIVDTAEDGSVTAEIPYSGTTWVARQVVARLGTAEVIEPAEVRDAVRALALELLR